MNPHLTAFTSD